MLVDDDAGAYADRTSSSSPSRSPPPSLVRLAEDAYDVTLVCGDHRVVDGSLDELLDSTCRIETRAAGDLLAAGQDAAALIGGAQPGAPPDR